MQGGDKKSRGVTKMKKIINSFIVDNGEKKRFTVELIKYSGSGLIRHLYSVHWRGDSRPFFTKFFAKRFFRGLKEGYKSAKGYPPFQLRYIVYDDI